MPESYYQLIRVHGGVEPVLLKPKIEPTWKPLRKVVIEHLKAEPYDEEDGIFVLHVEAGTPLAIYPFSALAMEGIRKEAENTTTSSRKRGASCGHGSQTTSSSPGS